MESKNFFIMQIVIAQRQEVFMEKRVIICAETTMTLISGIYYADQIKKRNPRIKTVLIWRDTTKYKISVNHFRQYLLSQLILEGLELLDWNTLK